MKYLKMLGLAAVAAMALMAFGAGTASATKLCSTNTNPCTGTVYGKGTAIKTQLQAGTIANLTTSTGNVTCTTSSIEGKTTSGGGGTGVPVEGEITSLKFSSCTLDVFGSPSCTVTATGIPTKVEANATSNGNGTLSTGSAGATVNCAGWINCTFTAPGILLTVTGGNPAHVTATQEVLAGSGVLCPSEARWDATYEVTAPKPLFLTVS